LTRASQFITGRTAQFRDDGLPETAPLPVMAKAHEVVQDQRMNKTEARYADLLESERLGGSICSWRFEAVKLRMADLTWYTPDFLVIRNDGTIDLVEVKGFWRDDARVKWKTIAELYPEFRIVSVEDKKGEWVTRVAPSSKRTGEG